MGKAQFAKLEQEGDIRYVHKAALETLGRLQEPVLEETEQALQKAIRLYPQNAEAHYILGVLRGTGERNVGDLGLSEGSGASLPGSHPA